MFQLQSKFIPRLFILNYDANIQGFWACSLEVEKVNIFQKLNTKFLKINTSICSFKNLSRIITLIKWNGSPKVEMTLNKIATAPKRFSSKKMENTPKFNHIHQNQIFYQNFRNF